MKIDLSDADIVLLTTALGQYARAQEKSIARWERKGRGSADQGWANVSRARRLIVRLRSTSSVASSGE